MEGSGSVCFCILAWSSLRLDIVELLLLFGFCCWVVFLYLSQILSFVGAAAGCFSSAAEAMLMFQLQSSRQFSFAVAAVSRL